MSSRGKRSIILSSAAAVTALIAIGGVLLLRDPGEVREIASQDLAPRLSASAEASPEVSESPSPSPSPSPSKSPSPKPKPSRKPTNVPKPPTQPTKPSGCVPHYEGTNVPREQVGAALDAAAAKKYWSDADISTPRNLVKAVAEQESGWQSAIVSCIGAVGAMQVLPSTATWMNGRFGVSYDVRTVSGNAMQGARYLQWLVRYFGEAYYPEAEFSLSPADCSKDPAVPDHRESCLLNTIISAYNVGHGTVEKQLDKAEAEGSTTFYVNHAYIENVRALMSRF